MSPTLRFHPLSNSAFFEDIEVDLSEERTPYLVGFRLDPTDSSVTLPMDVQTSQDWPGYKFDIVPYGSTLGSQMRHPLAAIWKDKYRVYVLPAEHINIFFQRAIQNNEKWTKIKTGNVFDLSEPLMTALDSAVHIKIETTPVVSYRAEFIKKLHDTLHPDHSIRDHEHLIKHFHVGIERPDEFLRHSGKEILANVTVDWRNSKGHKANEDTQPEIPPQNLQTIV